MSLSARVDLRLGELHLDVALEVATGEVVALLGPNGAGKTTLLRVLAGLERPDSGLVVLDGEVLDDPGRRLHVPPERRPAAMVFQDHLLFPHLSVLDNVAFALRSRRVPRAEARARALEGLREMGLEDWAGRRPAALSAGQAQQVALARALAGAPRLLLLDEPLAALDVSTRAAVRRHIRRSLERFGGTRLLVTHDPMEAMVLADRLVILEDGRVVQDGSPAEVRARPRSRFVADFAGLNLFSGHGRGETVHLQGGGVLVASGAGHDPVYAVIRPQAVALHRRPPSGTPRNVWKGAVDSVYLDVAGGRARVTVSGAVPLVAEVTAAAVAELDLDRGGPVWASVKASEVSVYPA